MKKTLLTLGAAGMLSASTVLLGMKPAHAAPKSYSCTRIYYGRTVTITVHTDLAEDHLEARGYSCTGDID